VFFVYNEQQFSKSLIHLAAFMKIYIVRIELHVGSVKGRQHSLRDRNSVLKYNLNELEASNA
jgi:hypothetical protein